MSDKIDSSLRKMLSTMNEAQIRWVLGREAMLRGRGGLKQIHELTGVSRPTIIKGIREVTGKRPLRLDSRIRRFGGGRKDFLSRRLNRHRGRRNTNNKLMNKSVVIMFALLGGGSCLGLSAQTKPVVNPPAPITKAVLILSLTRAFTLSLITS